jgi:hypothetical protein
VNADLWLVLWLWVGQFFPCPLILSIHACSSLHDFASSLVSGELLVSPLVHSFSLLSFPLIFIFHFCQSVFCLVLVVVVCC